LDHKDIDFEKDFPASMGMFATYIVLLGITWGISMPNFRLDSLSLGGFCCCLKYLSWGGDFDGKRWKESSGRPEISELLRQILWSFGTKKMTESKHRVGGGWRGDSH